MKLRATTRLLADEAYDSGHVNNNKDMTWQKDMNEEYEGKPRPAGSELPEGTFKGSPGDIANTLKTHSKDHGEASSKLNSYINRTGKNLQGADKARLNQAKDALKQAYGMDTTKTTSSSETSIYALPPGHNMDDGLLETGLDADPEAKPLLNATRRLA